MDLAAILAFGGREQPFLAEPALAAADGERRHYPVADLKVGRFRSEFDDLAHIFVAKNVTALHCRLISIQEMQVRAKDCTRGNLDDGITRMLDLRIRNRVHPDVAFSVPA